MSTNQVQVSSYPALWENQILKSDSYASLLYCRGYLFTDGALPEALGSNWGEIAFGGQYFYWDRRQPLVHVSVGNCEVLICGRVLDVDALELAPEQIVEELALKRSETRAKYLARLDSLGGRYVVLDTGLEGTYIQTDATGMRSAHYSERGSVSSHARLVAEASGLWEKSEFMEGKWMSRSKAFTFPGRYTEWLGVYLLTPNTELRVESAEVQRVGPSPLPMQTSALDVARKLQPKMQGQLLKIAGEEPLLISLTGGLDSRVTLALSRPIVDEVLYFTYARPYRVESQSSLADMRAATELAQHFGLPHRELWIQQDLQDDSLKNILAKNCARTHGHVLAAEYHHSLPEGVHVRSNLYEIGRSFYRGSQGRRMPPLDAQAMADILVKSSRTTADPMVRDAFCDWIKTARFDNFEGYDIYDLYYWEHRMAAWLNCVTIESDIAHDTFTVINSRSILRDLLSVPYEDRRDAKVFDYIVQLSWPELYEIPVNGSYRKLPT